MKQTITILFVTAAVAISGCAGMKEYNLPPANRLYEPGPGVQGPGPGVLPPTLPPIMGEATTSSTVQVLFSKPEGMLVSWDVGGAGAFDSPTLIFPGRQNFPQGAIYRLKLTNIRGREGVELYPTIEIGPTTPRTEAYLAHNAIPVQFTDEDFDQVLAGNFVTKVIYLPDPEFQELALAGVETLVSTRLDPGVDPIVEADRRGSIMAVIRLGNKDVESPGADVNAPQVITASHQQEDSSAGGPVAMGPSMGGPYGIAPNYISGVTSTQWGMPMSGTPIGLPGPPHIPLGGPAGLQKHVIRNHTRMDIPDPPQDMTIDVRSMPGYNYPMPANRLKITEQNIHPSIPFQQPHYNKHMHVNQGSGYGFGH